MNFTDLGNFAPARSFDRSLRSLHTSCVIGVIALLSGCTSMLNVGSPDYACPGMPGGVQCMSARDVYAATNNGNVPAPMVRADDPDDAKRSSKATEVQRGGSGDEVQASVRQPAPNDVVGNYVAPRLPDQPIPIRTPAQVMRIWVAPWEDANGDLNTTGYIYSEIEPRRWVVGEPVSQSAPVLRPLQSTRAANDNAFEERGSSTGANNNQARRAAEAATNKASAARQ